MIRVPYRATLAALAHSLATRGSRRLVEPDLRPAAVVVMLADRGGEVYVPLIVRAADTPVHGGQVALPGGGRGPGDESPIDTACRELAEELAVPRQRLDILGLLDDVPTPSGYLITPVVAAVGAAPLPYVPDQREVVTAFEAPLAAFLDRDAAELLAIRQWRGVTYQLRSYPVAEHKVWGATARILEDLVDRVRAR